MNRITHECQQGSQEWLDLRAHYFTASELSAAAGVSKYQKRGDLLKAKATGIAEEVDAAKQRLFDAGHAAESAARPIVEKIVDAELYPVTMSVEIDGLPLLASLDGIDILGDIIWENKLLNDALKSDVLQGRLSMHYAHQIEQQLLVSGASRCYFTTSDGTPEGTFGMWYESNPELRAKIVSVWKQFAEDLANYQHSEIAPVVVADTIEDLPALSVQLVGQVTASNLDSFKTAVTARIQAINTALVTDSDFATADKMVKFLDDGEKRLDMVKAQALAQTESIDQLFRTIDSLKAEMRSKRLTLDKLVKAEKENRKAEIVQKATNEFNKHWQALVDRVGVRFDTSHPGMGEATRGLKSLDSMRDKVSVALANAKIEANAVADRIDANRKYIDGVSGGTGIDVAAMFPDFAAVCTKNSEDFGNLVDSRIAANAKRLEAERERIRAEEEAKARREAEQKAQMAEHERLVAERAAAREAAASQQQQEQPAVCVQQMQKSETQPALTAESETQHGATLKLGEINAMLYPVSINADGLASLGILPVAHEKNAKLYEASKFPTICRLISEHVMAQAFKKAA